MTDPGRWRDELLLAIDRYDATGCAGLLARAADALPAEVLVADVLAPALHEAGLRWHRGRYSIAQEHMLSSAVLRLLAAQLDRHNPAGGARAVAFTTLAGDRHGVGALMAATIAARRGVRVLHLGWDLPVAELGTLARHVPLAAVALSVVARPTVIDALGQVQALRAALPDDVEIWLGGFGSRQMEPALLPPGTLLMSSLDTYTARLDALVAGGRGLENPS
jgi:methanogenic corrinoid protein MtbC1